MPRPIGRSMLRPYTGFYMFNRRWNNDGMSPVTMTMDMSRAISRVFPASSIPFIPGISKSVIIRRKVLSRSLRSASSPFAAQLTFIPCLVLDPQLRPSMEKI